MSINIKAIKNLRSDDECFFIDSYGTVILDHLIKMK